jgi:hypothetical protein
MIKAGKEDAQDPPEDGALFSVQERVSPANDAANSSPRSEKLAVFVRF